MYKNIVYILLISLVLTSCFEEEDLKSYGDNTLARIRIKPEKETVFQKETITLTAEFIYGDGRVEEPNMPVEWEIESGQGALSGAEGNSVEFTTDVEKAETTFLITSGDFSGTLTLSTVQTISLSAGNVALDGSIVLHVNLLPTDGKIGGADVDWSIMELSSESSISISNQVDNTALLKVVDLESKKVTVNLGGIIEEIELNVVEQSSLDYIYFSFDYESDKYANWSGLGVTAKGTYSANAIKGNGALSFDGTDYLILDKNDYVNAGKDYSVSYWFKTSTDAGGQNALWTMSRFTGDVSNDPWLPGGLTFRYTADAVNYDIGWEGGAAGSVNIADDSWHHLVTTIDYSDEEPDKAEIKIYIDGTEVVSNENSIIKPTWGEYWDGGWTGAAPVEDFVVKIGYGTSGSQAGTPFKGLVDDLKIYNSALSGSKVTELYNQ